MSKDYAKEWAEKAAAVLVGRSITGVRYLTEREREGLGWRNRSLVLILDDGTYIWPSADDEGNGAGSFFTTEPTLEVIPVIR